MYTVWATLWYQKKWFINENFYIALIFLIFITSPWHYKKTTIMLNACNNISTLSGTMNHLPNKSYTLSCYIKLFKVQNYIVYLMQEGKNWNDHGITWMLDEALNSMNIKVSIHKSENYDTICQRYQI